MRVEKHQNEGLPKGGAASSGALCRKRSINPGNRQEP
jgi:hypothetical protein